MNGEGGAYGWNESSRERIAEVGDMQKGTEESHFAWFDVGFEDIAVWMGVESSNVRRSCSVNVRCFTRLDACNAALRSVHDDIHSAASNAIGLGPAICPHLQLQSSALLKDVY